MVRYRDVERGWEEVCQSVRRRMVERLHHGGAMSLSKMAEPFAISLPAALKHARILEDVGIISSHKRGRVRICVLNQKAFREYSTWLTSQAAFWQGSFDRLGRHITKSKKKQ